MKTIRCAVYTRKSSEEGLDLSFNSLHAQREACEAYVLSQAGEGWTCLKTAYDDGGISGGHMERPGLKDLITDIKQDKVDVIVVYKVDRLTRSLTDFSKLVEVFDSHEVSFVSVTQAFNTTNSMGRLTLNVLLSFAQFEREVTGERIRDKIAMSPKRGLWTGGLPPLGYDAIDKKLVTNLTEAKTVKHIYQRYTELKNVRKLRAELGRDGYVSKRRTTKTGRTTGGKPFERGALYAILKNQTYLGLTTHKGNVFEGEHDPIISKVLFEKVQNILASNRRRDKDKVGAKNPSLLAGKITTPSGIKLTPSHAQTHGRRYRYYVERRNGKVNGVGKPDTHAIVTDRPIRLPADEIENSVRMTLANFLSDPLRLFDSLSLSSAPQDTQHAVQVEANGLAKMLKIQILQENGKALMMNLVGRIDLQTNAQGYKLHINIERLAEALGLPSNEDRANPIIHVPLKLQICNNGKKVIMTKEPLMKPMSMPSLISALKLAHEIKAEYMSASKLSLSDVAIKMGIDKRSIWRTLKLAFLAPDIQLAILSGTQPRGLCMQDVLEAHISVDWTEQRATLG